MNRLFEMAALVLVLTLATGAAWAVRTQVLVDTKGIPLEVACPHCGNSTGYKIETADEATCTRCERRFSIR